MAVIGFFHAVELLEILGEAVERLLVDNESLGSHEVPSSF